MSYNRREPYNAGLLHPAMIRGAQELTAYALERPFKSDGYEAIFKPFEGFRHPGRQNHLFAIGKVTKARPWESSHQYGLAVDFAVWRYEEGGRGVWRWPDKAPWGDLKSWASIFGLDVPIAWDRGHVQHPLFDRIRAII